MMAGCPRRGKSLAQRFGVNKHDGESGVLGGMPVQPDGRFTDTMEPAIGFEHKQEDVDAGFEMAGPANGAAIGNVQRMEATRQFQGHVLALFRFCLLVFAWRIVASE
jgi:hypothetical protein